MKLKQFYEALSKNIKQHPEILDLDIVMEYPTEHGISGITNVEWMDWDEKDYIISYLNLV